MVILRKHTNFYREIFKIQGIFKEPFLTLGYQEIEENIPSDFRHKDLKALLLSKGLKSIVTCDYFDPRADLKYDLNFPVPISEHEKYNVVFDIGTLEHIFDTRQAIENCMRMVRVDGLYFLHTPIKGYFGHGLHVFNPKGLIDILTNNNFKILYLKFSSSSGEIVRDFNDRDDILIWVIGKKIEKTGRLNIPQQRMWENEYKMIKETKPVSFFKHLIFITLKFFWHFLVFLKYRTIKILK